MCIRDRPTSATFSTDLHSLGQFIQEGTKVLYETIMQIKEPAGDITIPSDKDDLDGLNYLAGKSVDYVNKKACEGTVDAHVNTGNVPNILITLDKMDAYGFGYMVYFFEMSCAMSVYLLEMCIRDRGCHYIIDLHLVVLNKSLFYLFVLFLL